MSVTYELNFHVLVESDEEYGNGDDIDDDAEIPLPKRRNMQSE